MRVQSPCASQHAQKVPVFSFCVFLALLQRVRRKAVGEGKLVALKRGWQPPSLFAALRLFSLPSMTASLSLVKPPGACISAPGRGQCQHSDACMGEWSVDAEWFGRLMELHRHVARRSGPRVRSENGGRELDKNPPSVSLINHRAGILK